jgi:hypothetical protein
MEGSWIGAQIRKALIVVIATQDSWLSPDLAHHALPPSNDMPFISDRIELQEEELTVTALREVAPILFDRPGGWWSP